MDVKEFCLKLDSLLKNRDLRTEGLGTAINTICLGLDVGAGEIALLLADEEAAALRFLWPRGLQGSGTVPFSSKESLAARTFRERKSTVDNRFSATRHASIFEALPLKEQGGKALPIQKIISVPIHNEKKCFGVLQVCRKAPELAAAGPDFSRLDLEITAKVGMTLARHLKETTPD